MPNEHLKRPNESLLGRPGSRGILETPCLILDLDVLERNIQKMAQFAREQKIALRPHTKTHKSVRIAQMQLQAGAVGVCTTTVAEAEVLVNGGIDQILITSPVVGANKIARLIRLHEMARGEILSVVDNLANARELAAAAAPSGKPFPVLVDVDLGRKRTGISTPESAVALASFIHDASSLRFRGIQAYAGHVQHVVDLGERRQALEVTMQRLKGVLQELHRAGLHPEIVSGGGTGSFSLDAQAKIFNELQVGSYVFMDADYNRLAHTQGAPNFETSLFILSSVVSANHPGLATVDAGIKSMATDSGPPSVLAGAPVGTRFQFAGDEHGILELPDANARLEVGERILCVTPHCDPTINLYDWYHCVRGDELVDLWPVDGRGCSL